MDELQDWAVYQQQAFDRLPKAVRAAVRDYPLNIDAAELLKVGRNQHGMLALIRQRPPLVRDWLPAEDAAEAA